MNKTTAYETIIKLEEEYSKIEDQDRKKAILKEIEKLEKLLK